MANGSKRRVIRYIFSFLIAFAAAIGIQLYVIPLGPDEIMYVTAGIWLLLMIITYPLNRINMGSDGNNAKKKKKRR